MSDAPNSHYGAIEPAVRLLHDGHMKSIAINEARTHFSRLMRRVAAGEEIVIARGTTPVARLVAVKPAEQRRLGIDAGKFTVPDNLNHPITEDSLDLFGL